MHVSTQCSVSISTEPSVKGMVNPPFLGHPNHQTPASLGKGGFFLSTAPVLSLNLQYLPDLKKYVFPLLDCRAASTF